MGGGGKEAEEVDKLCCGHLFPSINNYVAHLAEKAPKDVLHEIKLIELNMLKCSVCSTWVHRDSMSLHLKKTHGVVEVIKNAKETPSLTGSPLNKSVIAERPLKCGENYVIRIGGRSVAGGQPFRVSLPSSGMNTINVTSSSIMSKPPMKLISSSSNSHYPKAIHLQQMSRNAAGKVIVRQSLPNTAVPVVTYGPRIIMKSCTKPLSSKNGIPINSTGVQKIVSVASNKVLQEATRSVNLVTALKISGGTFVATPSPDLGKTEIKFPAKQKLNVNQKPIIKRIQIVEKNVGNKDKSKNVECTLISSKKSDLVKSFLFEKSSANKGSVLKNGISDINCEYKMSEPRTAEINSKKNTLFVKGKQIEKADTSAKVAALHFTFSENTSQNSNDNGGILNKTNGGCTEKGNLEKEKGRVGNKKTVTNCKVFNQIQKKQMECQTNTLNNQPDKVLSRIKNIEGVQSNLLSSEMNINCRESEKTSPKTNKKQRKQILKPVVEPDGYPNVVIPVTSKVKVRKRGRKASIGSESRGNNVDQRRRASVSINHKNSKILKETESVAYKSTPKSSQASGRGGHGGYRKKGVRGRPRKVQSLDTQTPDLSNLDSLFEEENDTENDPLLLQQTREDENVPTVELDLFTLPSHNEQVSVLLTEPQNPDFKVYASMDAIFVGDSALGDVTNQIGYVTDANNVVFVNPSHFLFPDINELDKFVPSPIVTMKEKVNQSPKKTSKLASRSRQVICFDKRVMVKNVQDGSEHKIKKRVSMDHPESPVKGKKQCKTPASGNVSPRDTVAKFKSPKEGRVRRHSARLSGEPDDALSMPLVLKSSGKCDVISKEKKSSKIIANTEKSRRNAPCSESYSLDKKEKNIKSVSAIHKSASDLRASCGKKLSVVISPLKSEHPYNNDLKIEKEGTLCNNGPSLKDCDNLLGTCKKAKTNVKSSLADNLKCDILSPETSAKTESTSPSKPKTRARSADCVNVVRNTRVTDPVSNDKSNCNKYLSKRKMHSKSGSGTLSEGQSAEGSKISSPRITRMRARHHSNDQFVNLSPKPLKTLENDHSNKDSVHFEPNNDLSAKDVRKNWNVEENYTRPISRLLENSVIKGSNWTMTTCPSQRPIRDRRPSSKWLESIANDRRSRRESIPRLRSVRSASDTTYQSPCRLSKNIINEGINKTSVLDVSRLNKVLSEGSLDNSNSIKKNNDTECFSLNSGTLQVQKSINKRAVQNDDKVINIKNHAPSCEEIGAISESDNVQKERELIKNVDFPLQEADLNIHSKRTQGNVVEIEKSNNIKSFEVEHNVAKSAEGQMKMEESLDSSISETGNHAGATESTVVFGVEGACMSSEGIRLPETPIIFTKESVDSEKRKISNLKKVKLKHSGNMVNVCDMQENWFDKKDNCVLNELGGDKLENKEFSETQNIPEQYTKESDTVNDESEVMNHGTIKWEKSNDKVTLEHTHSLEGVKISSKYMKEPEQANNRTQLEKVESDSTKVNVDDHETKNIENNYCDIHLRGLVVPESKLGEESVQNDNEIAVHGTAEHQLINTKEDSSNTNEGSVYSGENIREGREESIDRISIVETVEEVNSEYAEEGKIKPDSKTLIEPADSNTKNTETSVNYNSTNAPHRGILCVSNLLTEVNKADLDDKTCKSIQDKFITEERAVTNSKNVSTSCNSYLSSLHVEVNDIVKDEVTSGTFTKGKEVKSRKSLSPLKGFPDGSPSREWHGRGAKLKAQVLIQDQQTGVTDSHIVSSNNSFTSVIDKVISPPKMRKMANCDDDGALSHKNLERGHKVTQRLAESVGNSPDSTVVISKSPVGSSKVLKSPKSPKVHHEEREWQARGAKLKAQIMITDQQTGQANTIVQSPETTYSSVSLLKSPPIKKMKLESSPESMKDIRSFFTASKSPERLTVESENETNSFSSPCSSSMINLPATSLSNTSPQSLNSSTVSSPRNIIYSPEPSPSSGKRKKVKLYTVTNSDIRKFLCPVSGKKRKLESMPLPDTNESLKTESEVSSAEITENTVEENIVSYFPCQSIGQCSKARVPVRDKVLTRLQKPALDFEGFQYSSRRSGLRARSLFRLVSLLGTKRWYGLDHFPLPVDELCDWNEEMLDIKVFDKCSPNLS